MRRDLPDALPGGNAEQDKSVCRPCQEGGGEKCMYIFFVVVRA